jgi:hypothetical protein
MKGMRTRVLLVVIGMATASCGGGLGIGAETLAPTDLTAAADRTAQKRSALMSFLARFEGLPGFEEPLVMTGESQADLSGRRYRSEVDFPVALLGEEGTGNRTQPTSLIKDDSVFYLSMPFLSEALQSPTDWIRMDLEDLPQGTQELRSLATGQNDPSQVLNYLRGAAGDFRKVGEVGLGGVPTTQYHGTVDLDLAAERAPPDMRERVGASRSEVESQLGTTKLPTDVWLDDDGIVRQVRYVYPLPGEMTGGRLVFTTDLSDFGLEVDVTPPSEDQVTDIQDLVPTGE